MKKKISIIIVSALLICMLFSEISIAVNPVASFTYEPIAPFTSDIVYFNSTSYDIDGNIVNWTWDFGDLTIGYGEFVTHSYIDGGVYAVNLTVLDNNSDSDFVEQIVTISNCNPVVTDIPDQTIVEGASFATIILDDYVSDVEDADDVIVWEYSGNVELIVDITDRVATIGIPHVDWNGQETITFKAIDTGMLNDSDDATFTVTSVNDPPVASFTYEPIAPFTSDIIYFNSTSYDIDGNIVNWTWDFGDLTIGYGEFVTHSYINSGVYTVNLTVLDNNSDSDFVEQIVTIIQYAAWSITLNITEQSEIIGDNVIFGEKLDASDGQDVYDSPKPDIPPAPYIYAWFDADLPEPYNVLWEDYRHFPGYYNVWDLYVVCNTTIPTMGTINLIISWNTVSTNAIQYDYIGLYESDILVADMKNTDTYMFTAEFDCIYHFQIKCSMNTAPTAYNDLYTTGEGNPLIISTPGVLENDIDIDNDPLTAILVSPASNGTLTLYENGSFEYMPGMGFSGIDTFTYKANDGKNNSIEATVTITVYDYCHVPLQSRWNFISLPVSESIDKTQIIIRNNSIDYTWTEAVNQHIILDVIYGWNKVTQNYVLESSTIKPGEGYWMWSYQNCEILVYSDEVGTGHITTFQQKWNLFGMPYNTYLPKENITVFYSGTEYSWEEATTDANPTGKPIILEFIYGWDNLRYEYSDGFYAGDAYWMYAYESCALINNLI